MKNVKYKKFWKKGCEIIINLKNGGQIAKLES